MTKREWGQVQINLSTKESLDKNDFLGLVINPSLDGIGMGGDSAAILLLGVAIIESGLCYLKQHQGPALGFYQIEPITHRLVVRWLSRNTEIQSKVLMTCGLTTIPYYDEPLIYHLKYATCIARCLFASVREPLPKADDAQSLAEYHKAWYNRHGKTDISKSRLIFEDLIHDKNITW